MARSRLTPAASHKR